MKGHPMAHKQTASILVDEDLLDHIYDPPLWSAGPYLKMVDNDITSCYSPVSDPLLRARLSSEDTIVNYPQERDCRIMLSESNEQTTSSVGSSRLSRKTVYLITSCLTISALLLTFMVCL